MQNNIISPPKKPDYLKLKESVVAFSFLFVGFFGFFSFLAFLFL